MQNVEFSVVAVLNYFQNPSQVICFGAQNHVFNSSVQ